MAVQTVLGNVPAETLGITLTHEHLSLDFFNFYCEPPQHLQSYVAETEKIKLANLGVLRQYPYSSLFNIKFNDNESHESVAEDLGLFKKWGGGTIVENTSHGLKRDLKFYREMALRSGVNIVAGTGHYLELTQSQSARSMSLETMINLYTNELTTGIDVNNDGKDFIKCGIIGEVGSVWPITEFEQRAIRAAGEVRETIGCGVTFHPGRSPDAPFEIMRLYLEAGGKADKCVMSHLDRTIRDTDRLLEFATTGAYCQFDLFGTECSFYQLNTKFDMPSDAQRMDQIFQLVEDGYDERILISQDIHTKHRLVHYGGHGYSHIINSILPRLKSKGLSTEQIQKISIQNPARWLEF